MIKVQENGLTYYRFEIFDDCKQLTHGIFTKYGGESPPPRQGLNMTFFRGEPEEPVQANIKMAADAVGCNNLAYIGQVHSDKALVVRAENQYTPKGPQEVIQGYDAMITPDRDIGLLITLADCQGVLLFDPNTEVLALIHSGWRGSVQNIIGKTANRMVSEFGVDPSNILAGIGPSLGPCCAEFKNYKDELPESFLDYKQGFNFDFWAISRDQLTEAGLKPDNIEISQMCTKCGEEGFYSYRGDGLTGRFGFLAGLVGE